MSLAAVINPGGPQDVAARLLGPMVSVEPADPRDPPSGLLPGEQRPVAAMVERRRRSFAAGRRAARGAMIAQGMAPAAVPMGNDRAPVWPAGLTGSITHSDRYCLAAVARSANTRALGIDIEARDAVGDDLVPEICTLAERAWLGTQPREVRGALASLVFSAKETAYKCQYTLSQTLFGFQMLDITPDLDTGQFEATFVESVPGFEAGTQLHGQFCFGADWVLTTMRLARPDHA
ncbi:MAG: 4'-phosphopantetheinyl transferase superfamily protein [Rhodobacteraceae bacterium]|nr:4'-phosphopantetheinyl transferase superfamily protein [Paracoccaceae bacterium]